MDLARAPACQARQGKTCGAPWADGNCRHSLAPWHMTWLVVTGCDKLLAGGCRNLVFWAMQNLCQQLQQA